VAVTFAIFRSLPAVGLLWDLHGGPDHVRAAVAARATVEDEAPGALVDVA